MLDQIFKPLIVSPVLPRRSAASSSKRHKTDVKHKWPEYLVPEDEEPKGEKGE